MPVSGSGSPATTDCGRGSGPGIRAAVATEGQTSCRAGASTSPQGPGPGRRLKVSRAVRGGWCMSASSPRRTLWEVAMNAKPQRRPVAGVRCRRGGRLTRVGAGPAVGGPAGSQGRASTRLSSTSGSTCRRRSPPRSGGRLRTGRRRLAAAQRRLLFSLQKAFGDVAGGEGTWWVDGLAVHAELREGSAGPVLCAAAGRPSQLVVGARGHSRAVGVLLGSVSQYVTAHAPCPVTVVREAEDLAALVGPRAAWDALAAAGGDVGAGARG